jgi:hypothetical protein
MNFLNSSGLSRAQKWERWERAARGDAEHRGGETQGPFSLGLSAARLHIPRLALARHGLSSSPCASSSARVRRVMGSGEPERERRLGPRSARLQIEWHLLEPKPPSFINYARLS